MQIGSSIIFINIIIFMAHFLFLFLVLFTNHIIPVLSILSSMVKCIFLCVCFVVQIPSSCGPVSGAPSNSCVSSDKASCRGTESRHTRAYQRA